MYSYYTSLYEASGLDLFLLFWKAANCSVLGMLQFNNLFGSSVHTCNRPASKTVSPSACSLHWSPQFPSVKLLLLLGCVLVAAVCLGSICTTGSRPLSDTPRLKFLEVALFLYVCMREYMKGICKSLFLLVRRRLHSRPRRISFGHVPLVRITRNSVTCCIRSGCVLSCS